MRYLFMFTIGPVKTFIENSRKARDLYAGSKLLSELMDETVRHLSEKQHASVLFPVSQEDGALPNMPNRLVAELDGYTKEQIEADARELSAFVRRQFMKKSGALLQTARLNLEQLEFAKRQLADFLEVYWACTAYGNEDYSAAYQRLLGAMFNVKSIRQFSQIGEPWGRKCMLYQEYNGIFAKKSLRKGEMSFPANTNPDCVYDITDNPCLRYLVKKNEAISAVGLVKRLYSRGNVKIYSTRQMLFLRRVTESLLEECGLSKSDDVQLGMAINAVYDIYNGNSLSQDEYSPEIVPLARHMYEKVKEKDIRLSTYYSIIKFDGDSMGECFKQLKTVEQQRKLSDKINAFACKAPDIFLEYGGLPIFAGGEDFLGLLPLDGLLQCLEELNREFQRLVHLTFSAGISIAHLMQPLKEVLEQADLMEATAKSMEGKQAFSVGIIKRSGENVRLPAYHFAGTGSGPGLEQLKKLIELLQTSGCSNSLFYQITNQMKYFAQEKSMPEEPLMVRALIFKCVTGALVDHNRISGNELTDRLMEFYLQSKSVEDFLGTLNGITFLAREAS